MARTLAETNLITRYALGLAVILGMLLGGGTVAQAFVALGIPYGRWIGVLFGGVLVFVLFSVWYAEYSTASGGNES